MEKFPNNSSEASEPKESNLPKEKEPLRISFDYDQLDYIKFRLNFSDGFLFGLGMIAAWIIFFIFAFSIITIIGVSLSGTLIKYLM